MHREVAHTHRKEIVIKGNHIERMTMEIDVEDFGSLVGFVSDEIFNSPFRRTAIRTQTFLLSAPQKSLFVTGSASSSSAANHDNI